MIFVEGSISDAAKLASEKAHNEGWFDVSTFKEPYRTEGKKIMGYELAEELKLDIARYHHLPNRGRNRACCHVESVC